MRGTAGQSGVFGRRRGRGAVVVRIGRVGFTLAELLVAVGVVAVLTLGIGRIFASVSKLVGTGAAVGEVDQIARVIEAQLRADFDAASRLGAAENFLVIRNMRVGDLDNDGTLDDPEEIDIYLTRDDEEFDLRRRYDAYQRKGTGVNAIPQSRAITVRLDQMMFLGRAPEGYRSFQPSPASEQVVSTALIMWGHGLRPPLDLEELEDRPRYRLNYPDGGFGFARGDANPFAPDDSQHGGESTGRNRYAGDFVLTRRAVLLAGGLAAGEQRVADGVNLEPLWGDDTEIALYPSDMESSVVFDSVAGFAGLEDADSERVSEGDGGSNGWGGVRRLPNPRLVRHGRTDILAVDAAGLQRWVEGTGVPFSAGRIGAENLTDPIIPADPADDIPDPQPLNPNRPNARLWWAEQVNEVGGPLDTKFQRNLRGVQTALAGMLHRVLVEPEPPAMRIDADDPATGYPGPLIPSHAVPDPMDRRMDMHAIIANHCSSFEIAWSDGSTWTRDTVLRLDADGDGKIDREIRRGDTIWFDMDFTVRDFWRLNGLGTTPGSKNESVYPRPNPDPEIGLTDARTFDETPSGVSRDQTHDVALNYKVNKAFAVETLGDADRLPGYSPYFNHMPFTVTTGGSPAPLPEQEYLAIWGFRVPEGADQGPNPASVGGYGRAWPKPRLIRVRMTLHDAQNRLEGGKQFEFVFRLNAEGT